MFVPRSRHVYCCREHHFYVPAPTPSAEKLKLSSSLRPLPGPCQILTMCSGMGQPLFIWFFLSSLRFCVIKPIGLSRTLMLARALITLFCGMSEEINLIVENKKWRGLRAPMRKKFLLLVNVAKSWRGLSPSGDFESLTLVGNWVFFCLRPAEWTASD